MDGEVRINKEKFPEIILIYQKPRKKSAILFLLLVDNLTSENEQNYNLLMGFNVEYYNIINLF